MKERYFPTVDFLRFFAASWVMADHFFSNTGGTVSFYKYGNLGVPLFFIISGFVIPFSVQGKTLKGFILSRFIRLYPLFWFACLMTYVTTLIVPNGNPVSLHDLLINLTMLGEKGGASRLVDASYWSLAVEIAFYLGIGIFVSLFSFRKVRFFYAFWILTTFLIFFFGVESQLWAQFTLARHAPYFIFGGFLALLIQESSVSSWKQKLADVTGMLVAASLAFYAMDYSLLPYWLSDPRDRFYVSLINILFFICVPLMVYASKYMNKPASVKWATVAGGVTYPVYLLNQKLGGMMIDAFGVKHSLSFITASTFVLVILVSYVLYIYDKQLRKFLLINLPLVVRSFSKIKFSNFLFIRNK